MRAGKGDLAVFERAVRKAATAAGIEARRKPNEAFDAAGWFDDWVDGRWLEDGKKAFVPDATREEIRDAVHQCDETRVGLANTWIAVFEREMGRDPTCANCLRGVDRVDSSGMGVCCSFPS